MKSAPTIATEVTGPSGQGKVRVIGCSNDTRPVDGVRTNERGR
jgi:hypothetical protein